MTMVVYDRDGNGVRWWTVRAIGGDIGGGGWYCSDGMVMMVTMDGDGDDDRMVMTVVMMVVCGEWSMMDGW